MQESIVPAAHELPDDERYVPVIPQDAATQYFSHQGVVTVKYNFSDAAKLPETLARLAEKGLKRVNLAMEDLMTLEDVELTDAEKNEAQRKALDNGVDEEIYIELEKTKKTRLLYQAQMKAQKLQEEVSRATKEKADSDIAAFKAKYKDIKPQ